MGLPEPDENVVKVHPLQTDTGSREVKTFWEGIGRNIDRNPLKMFVIERNRFKRCGDPCRTIKPEFHFSKICCSRQVNGTHCERKSNQITKRAPGYERT